jgi:membrane protease YdiL (CAAX protease family)
VLTAIVVALRVSTPETEAMASSVDRGAWRGHVMDFIAAFAVKTLLMPVAEELTFRGIAYGPLFRKFGPVGAALGTAILWAGGHYAGPSIESTFKVAFVLVLGVAFAEVYRRRESIVPTVTLHIVANTTSVFIGDPHLQTLLPLGIIAVVLWISSIVAFRWLSPVSAVCRSDRPHGGIAS